MKYTQIPHRNTCKRTDHDRSEMRIWSTYRVLQLYRAAVIASTTFVETTRNVLTIQAMSSIGHWVPDV